MHQVSSSIKTLRKKKRMTQEQLAEKLNVTHQAVSNWETGKTQPDIETLTRIAEYFGVSVEWLIYGKDEKTDTGTIKRTWSWGNTRLSVTYYPERLVWLGTLLAAVISYVNWRSIAWAILHAILGWVYVIYYIIRY